MDQKRWVTGFEDNDSLVTPMKQQCLQSGSEQRWSLINSKGIHAYEELVSLMKNFVAVLSRSHSDIFQPEVDVSALLSKSDLQMSSMGQRIVRLTDRIEKLLLFEHGQQKRFYSVEDQILNSQELKNLKEMQRNVSVILEEMRRKAIYSKSQLYSYLMSLNTAKVQLRHPLFNHLVKLDTDEDMDTGGEDEEREPVVVMDDMICKVTRLPGLVDDLREWLSWSYQRYSHRLSSPLCFVTEKDFDNLLGCLTDILDMNSKLESVHQEWSEGRNRTVRSAMKHPTSFQHAFKIFTYDMQGWNVFHSSSWCLLFYVQKLLFEILLKVNRTEGVDI